MSDATRQELQASRVKTEIFYAVLFTGLTLALAAGMLTMLPVFQEYMRDVNPELIHKRSFEVYPDGGAIVYAPASGNQVSDRAIQSYRDDLEILSRRFERGHFEMATLSGLQNAPVLKEVLNYRDDYSYSVESSDNMAVLRIKSDSRQATEAMQSYLKFLEKNWVFHR